MSISKFEFFTTIMIVWMLASVLTEISLLEHLGFSVKEFYEKEYEKQNYSSTAGLLRIIFVAYWVIHIVPSLAAKLVQVYN